MSNDDITKILKSLVTKEDLENLTTKDDLKNLATKNELKNLATRDEIESLATKEEIKKIVKALRELNIKADTIMTFADEVNKIVMDHEKKLKVLQAVPAN